MSVSCGELRLVINEIAANDSAGLEDVARLHMDLLAFGPMAGLGKRFVREVCYRMQMEERLLRTAVAYVNGEPAGLVAYTNRSADFHRRSLAAHPLRTAWELMLAVLSSPRRLYALARVFRVLASRRAEKERIDHETGEIVCIAVRSRYLEQKFSRLSGARLSESLVRRAARYLVRSGCRQMRMLVDKHNKQALLLYHFLGARFESATLGGEPQMEVWFDFRHSSLEKEHSPPSIWLGGQGIATDGSGGWTDYWERIEDRQRFFEAEASDYAHRLRRYVGLRNDQIVLDFGCGFGWVASNIAAYVAAIDLWDGAASVRRRALLQTAHLDNVTPIDLAAAEAQLRGRYHLILVHSVVQYMTVDELRSWLTRWKALLAPDGVIVMSDVVPPQGDLRAELARYLAFGIRAGILLNQLTSGIREIRRYLNTRESAPLLALVPEEVQTLAESAGLTARMLEKNLSYRESRRTFLLYATR